MKVHLTINIPSWVERIFVWPVMVYRRRRFGYPFRRIYLGEGEWTIVDPEDYYRFGNFKWSISGNGANYYALRNIKGGSGRTKTVLLHREIIKPPPGLVVDHKNGITLDNRRANLRLATHSQNMHNRRKTKSKTSSRFIGVFFDNRIARWAAKIRYQGKRFYLGSFKNEIAAAKAYDAAAKEYHGEFARLNFTP